MHYSKAAACHGMNSDAEKSIFGSIFFISGLKEGRGTNFDAETSIFGSIFPFQV